MTAEHKPPHPLLQLFSYSKKYCIDIIVAAIYSLLNKVFDILPEIMIGVAVDIVVKRQHSIIAYFGITDVKDQIIILGAITGFVWVCESLFQYLYSLKWCYLAQNIQHDMRMDAYSHVQKLPLEYFEDKSTGNVMSILNDDINQLERFLNDGVNQILQIGISTILIAMVFFYISAKVAILSFIPIPFILFGSFYFRKHLAPLYLTLRNKVGKINSKLGNNLLGIATIKSFTAEQYEDAQLEHLSNEYKTANKNAIVVSAAITPVIRMAVMTGFLITLIYGGILTIDGVVAVAAYSVLIFLSQRLLWPLTYLATVIDTYQRSMASIKRVMGLLETPIKIKSGTRALHGYIKGSVSFNRVYFNYAKRKTLFNGLSFTIDAGSTVAFVGSTGSGKSTIMKLLLRFYELKSGAIFIDGYNINTLDFVSLRKNIGLVSQDTFLIDGTILENISYGSFSKTRGEIIAAATIADADGFISRLPHGYETIVGERGQKLSGGQRQRIAIARAVLKNPPILILDEATSALDNKTEVAVQNALQRVSKDRTTIVIAHRLSTVVNADKICVLNHGAIVEQGTHKELLALGGRYKHLWELQMRDQDS